MFNLDIEYSIFVSVVSLFVSVTALFMAVVIFTIQQRQGKNLQKLVKDVHTFAEDQKDIKNLKRKRYAKGILSILNLIDYDLEGCRTQLTFLKNNPSNTKEDQSKSIILDHYERIQNLFMNMKIEYDTVLEVFNHEVEEQYQISYRTVMSHKDIWKHNLDDINTLDKSIQKIETEMKKFNNLLIDFIPSEFRSKYERLFETK